MWTKRALRALGSQPGPHEQRERQYQRPGPEVRVRARVADRREALIGRPVAHRRGTVAVGVCLRFAEAARSSAVAPIAGCGMAGIGDRRKRRRTDEFGTIGR